MLEEDEEKGSATQRGRGGGTIRREGEKERGDGEGARERKGIKML